MSTIIRKNERSWAIDLISRINLIAKNNVEKLNPFTMSKSIIYNWINLLR